jgi:serine/threonine protein kinase
LRAAHACGVIHRDLKPENVILGDGGTAKILDFGISKAYDLEAQTREGQILGTPQYMSPEQVSCKPLDARSDLYSLGTILYEMVTGFPPFQGDSPISTALMHTCKEPRRPEELNPLVPGWLQAIILRLLAKDREKRFASADEVLEAVARGEAAYDTRETRDLAAPEKPKTRARRYLYTAGIALGICLVAFIALRVFYRFTEEKGILDDGVVTVSTCRFSILQNDPELLSFSDALEESLQARVAEIGSIRVIPKLVFAGASESQSEMLKLAPNRGVEQIISGKVNSFGSDLRVDIQVLDVATSSIFMVYSETNRSIPSLDFAESIANHFKEAYRRKIAGLKRGKASGLVSVSKRPFSAISASICGISCAAYVEYASAQFLDLLDSWRSETASVFVRTFRTDTD